ncbi:MAG: arginine--tRNA ligase, partial [Candidatus Latescibacteria bacterium]|nr:arginine--tRNA ligase [Candidatus Latescibacterota bacterium]
CFSLAKTLRKLPVQIAEDIVEKLPVGGPIVEATSAGPYVNVRINRKLMTAQVLGDVFSRTTRFGNSNVGKDELVVIDYSSPNVAKRFHVGHLSSTVIGGALANMFECLGYSVLRINHLGDWGTQFGKLIVAFHNWGDDDELKRAPIEHLEQLYVRFHTEAETQPELDDQARDWSRRLEEGDSDARELWQLFRDVSIDELEQIYKRLGVRFDHYHGEAFYEPLLNDTIDAVESSGQLELSDDAMVIKFPESEDMPPMLLRRSDGATLYATRDLAAAYYRWKTFKFTKCLYVVGQDQALHFKQLFTALEQLGCDWVDRVEHVGFGRVKGMSTRKGNV